MKQTEGEALLLLANLGTVAVILGAMGMVALLETVIPL
jgi:hypothetical protein